MGAVLAPATVLQAQDVALLSTKTSGSAVTEYSGTGNKTSSLQEFMQEFKKTYKNIFFSYQSNTLKSVKVQYNDLDVTRESNPDVVLADVLSTGGLQFEKIKEVYIIKQKGLHQPAQQEIAIPAAVVEAAVEQADFLVKGHVSDANGPLGGVTVTERGKSNATTTDVDGNFSLDVAGGNAVLVFTSVSFKTAEVSVNGRSQITVVMESAAQELEGVVVTALGITREKRSLGYSVGQIKGDDMNRVSQTNVLNAMAGKVSGVTISSTGGAATSSVSMVIRGIRSLNSDNQPLFVVDGMQCKKLMNNISTVGNGVKWITECHLGYRPKRYCECFYTERDQALQHYMVHVQVMA